MSEAQSIARRKMLTQPGRLYAAYSRYCDWIKVGFTLRLEDRLESIGRQYVDFAPFSLIGSVPSTWGAEQQLHTMLSPFRQRHTGRTKELYPAVFSVSGAMKRILANDEWQRLPFDAYREVRQWASEAAKHPKNRDPALESFALFYRERQQRILASAFSTPANGHHQGEKHG